MTDEQVGATPIRRSALETWQVRHTLGEAELSDAAGNAITLASNIMADHIYDDSVQQWLMRAQWYLLRLEHKRKQAWLAYSSSGYSKMYPPTGTDLTTEARPDHSSRRPTLMSEKKWTECDRDEPCGDMREHPGHSWGTTDVQLWCHGRNAQGIPYRPVRDSPQA